MLGDVRPYDPTPPPSSQLDIQKYPLKIASIAIDSAKKGWGKYKITLSNQIRSKYAEDPIHAPQWKELILDFDQKLLDVSFQHH